MRFLAAMMAHFRDPGPSTGKFLSFALPMAIGAFALLLRLHGLDDKPLWLDEITSLRRVTGTVPNLVADSLSHKHFPSYFLFLWLVAQLGTSQWLLRLPSAIFSAVAAALTSAIGRDAAGPRSGAAAGLLMALSPFEVQFGQEARSYALVSCLILVALWGLVRLARDPDAAARHLSRGAWIAYGLGTASALAVLNVAIPWLLASNLTAVAIACRASNARRAFLRKWGLVQAVILAAWLPLLACVYVASDGAVLRGVDWAPVQTAKTIWSVIASIYLFRISRFITFDLFPAIVPGLGFIIVLLAMFGAWRLRRNPAMLAVIGCPLLVVPLGLLTFSAFVPMLVPRYFAWSAALFFIFAGAGVGRLSGSRFVAVTAMLATACLVNLMPYYGYETKPRWDLLAAQLAADSGPGDIVLFDGYAQYVFSPFARRIGLIDNGVTLTSRLQDAVRLMPGRTLWVVYGRTGQGPMKPPDDYLRSLPELGVPMSENLSLIHIS